MSERKTKFTLKFLHRYWLLTFAQGDCCHCCRMYSLRNTILNHEKLDLNFPIDLYHSQI